MNLQVNLFSTWWERCVCLDSNRWGPWTCQRRGRNGKHWPETSTVNSVTICRQPDLCQADDSSQCPPANWGLPVHITCFLLFSCSEERIELYLNYTCILPM